MEIEDTPTHRTTFDELSLDTKMLYLEQIRDRRLEARRVYDELMSARKAVKDEKLLAKVDRLAKKISTRIDKIDKMVEECESMYREVKAIHLEIGPCPDSEE